MLNVLFTRALSEHLPTSIPLVPTSVNPGYCYSELRRHFTTNIARTIRFAVMDRLFARSGEEGARQLLWAALGPDGKEGKHTNWLRGAYVSVQSMKEPSDFVISYEGRIAQDKVWVGAFLRDLQVVAHVDLRVYRRRRFRSCRRSAQMCAPTSMSILQLECRWHWPR